ncbi:SAM-dependent methyltransferase [Stenotrophomonas ginsengisoli]|uniref:Release factor glutamine methyltransferase n=1 Tax=Stenotrophomonas ginsengisoli TaxID=336566 RepID=A0A0R0D517_9GAMM|nr:peptide chain release factor N(5)-glutamine methyltransferase [Stenotrophomonas ginsengisoli]KRG77196.1 SAM-dependent methyltransferase [Stenotrophomonas ginsengisoli]
MSVPLPATACAADLLAWAGHHLPTPEGRAEARLLLLHVLGQAPAWLYSHDRDPLDEASARRFGELVVRRAAGEPVAYLTGSRGFWTLDLAVTPATLIPRPETELLVEQALARLPDDGRPLRIADMGTGTGAIALALAAERPQAMVLATDLLGPTLAVAVGNAQRNGIANVSFRRGSWYRALGRDRFDLIVSNPPYIRADDAHLGQGDVRFEPPPALASGEDGLDAIRLIAAGVNDHLVPGGWLLLEHGWHQGQEVRELLAAAGLEAVQTVVDLEGRDRVSLGRRPGQSIWD